MAVSTTAWGMASQATVSSCGSSTVCGGRTNAGATRSTTRIVCTPLTSLPQPSTAVQVRSMTFSWPHSPALSTSS